MPMIRHVVLFAWSDEMTPDKEQQLAAELTGVATRMPGLRAYHAGADAGIVEGNFDFAVVADFDDADSYLAYRNNPEHQDIIRRLTAPHAQQRASVQYEI
jgi:antibiotic biosynthesis monooxygenase (ABM) superfamily enzyme